MSRHSVATTTLSVPEREALADDITLHTCLRNCMGMAGIAAGCCTLGTRDYIIGPIPDTEALLARLTKLWGREVEHDEIFIGHKEGSALFPDKPEWQREVCYPALRVKTEDASLPCIFLSDENLCSIHEIRSVTCSRYSCDHLKDLLVAI